MKKIKRAHLWQMAKAAGYSGAEDVEAVRKYFSDQGYTEIQTPDGTFEVKSFAVEDEAPAKKTLNFAPAAESAPDLENVVKAKVEAALKGAGVDLAGGNRINPNPAPVVSSVKSMAEVQWDRKKAQGRACFSTFEKAQGFRDFLLYRCLPAVPTWHQEAQSQVAAARERLQKSGFIDANGYVAKTYATTPNAAGGAVVFPEFSTDLINNVKQYGVSRGPFGPRYESMGSDQKFVPAKTGIHTLTYPQEAGSATASTGLSYSNVQLTAKTGVVLVKMSQQVLSDAGINFADDHATEIARAIAYTEDIETYTANGEAGYAGMVGVVGAIINLGITSTSGGAVTGGGDWSAHTDAHLATLMGKVPDYARARSAWHCSAEFAGTVFVRLARGQGGVTYKEATDGGYLMYYAGRPVIPNNVMNSTASTGTNTVDVVFGDLSLASILGDRMSVEIALDQSLYFDQYAVAMRGVVRHHVVCHDIGSTTAPGPVGWLYQT